MTGNKSNATILVRKRHFRWNGHKMPPRKSLKLDNKGQVELLLSREGGKDFGQKFHKSNIFLKYDKRGFTAVVHGLT